MTTSGTVSLTKIDATSVIEHAVRRCGVLATALTAEMQVSARENLFLILSSLPFKGAALWCIKKYVYAAEAGQAQLVLDLGIEEVLYALTRTFTVNAGTVIAGSATYSPGLTTPAKVNGAILYAPAGSYNFVLEGTNDPLAWTSYGSVAVTLSVSGSVSIDAEPGATLAYWRVRETLAGTVVLSSASFLTGSREIRMSPMSQDTYVSLPDKSSTGRPLQYWPDKSVPQQKIWLWQTAVTALTYQIVVWARRQVQDVGDLSNTLEVPQRWLEPLISELAPRICLELPKELVPANRYNDLLERARVSLNEVLDAEVDNTPIKMAPRIRAYTR